MIKTDCNAKRIFMKNILKKIVFVFMLGLCAHEIQAAQVIQAPAASTMAWTIKKSITCIQRCIAQVANLARQNAPTAIAGVAILFLFRQLYNTRNKPMIIKLAGRNTSSQDQLKPSCNLHRVSVLGQSGKTCGVHAVKNAMRGLHYFDNQDGAQQDMLSPNFYTNTFATDHLRDDLQDDEVQDLVQRLVPAEQHNNIYVLQNIEQVVNMFTISDQAGVLTEEYATMAYRLSQPSYIVSFVTHNKGRFTGGHWTAFTVKKENGIVRDIIFMDSLNGFSDRTTAINLLTMCSKNEIEYMEQLAEYNNNIPAHRCVERITGYKERGNGQLTDENINSLTEKFFAQFQTMVLENDKIIWQQQCLDDQAINAILEQLKLHNHLTDKELERLKTKIDDEKKARSIDTAQTDTATKNGGGGGEKID